MNFETLLLVGIGGFLAAMVRFHLTRNDAEFPWRTLATNMLGSLLLGLILTGLQPTGIWRELLVAGFCGTLTTFSAFAWQTVALAEHGRRLTALSYMLATTVLSVLGGWLGLSLGRHL